MKYLSLIFLFLIAGCESEGVLTRDEIGSIPVTVESELLYSGTFYPTAGIAVSGFARTYKDGPQYKVSLEEFSVSSGPDLKVYLSASGVPHEFVNLGALGNGATQTYLIPDGIDLETYTYVLIHCQQYDHLFAIAPLE
jgi:Electron transfer DM13